MYHTIKFCPQYTKFTYKVSTGITDHSSEQKPEIQLTFQDRKLVLYPMLSLILTQKSLSAEKQPGIVILVYTLAAGRKQTKVSQTFKHINVFVLSVFGSDRHRGTHSFYSCLSLLTLHLSLRDFPLSLSLSNEIYGKTHQQFALNILNPWPLKDDQVWRVIF